jgi:hypothetical protein
MALPVTSEYQSPRGAFPLCKGCYTRLEEMDALAFRPSVECLFRSRGRFGDPHPLAHFAPPPACKGRLGALEYLVTGSLSFAPFGEKSPLGFLTFSIVSRQDQQPEIKLWFRSKRAVIVASAGIVRFIP